MGDGDPQFQVQKGQSGTKISRTKIVCPSRTKIGWGTFGLWMMGMPKSKCKKGRADQKSAEQKLCHPAEQKLAEKKLVGPFGLWGDGHPQVYVQKGQSGTKISGTKIV